MVSAPVAPLLNLQFRTAVHSPTFRVISPVSRIRGDWLLFAFSCRAQPAGGNSFRDQVLLYGLRSPFGKSLVVLVRSDRVRMAFDGDIDIRIVLERLRRFIKNRNKL